MKVIVGSVVKGLRLKQVIQDHLRRQGHEVIDVGCPDTGTFYKFSAVGQRVAEALRAGRAPVAVNCCGSGTGASLAAGKFRGVCAVSCESVATARLARVVNDANCLCLGESIVSPELACQMVDAFLSARFQDAPDVPEKVRAFWQEARDEFMRRGPEPGPREHETLS